MEGLSSAHSSRAKGKDCASRYFGAPLARESRRLRDTEWSMEAREADQTGAAQEVFESHSTKRKSMLRELAIATLTLVTGACSSSMHKTDTPDTSRQQTAAQDAERMRALSAQLDNNDVQAYVEYVCGLPQPERWEKAKSLLANNHLVAACAFDKDHPMPEDSNRGPIAVVPPPKQQ